VAGLEACKGEKRSAYRLLVGKTEKRHWEDLDEGGKIILGRIIGGRGGMVLTGFVCFGIWTSGGRTCRRKPPLRMSDKCGVRLYRTFDTRLALQ
jgi:hypothetical protein